MIQETHEHRLKRMKMRAWRRGTREMDLLLGPYADQNLGTMSQDKVDLFDRLLQQNDPDLMAWVTDVTAAPSEFCDLISKLKDRAKTH